MEHRIAGLRRKAAEEAARRDAARSATLTWIRATRAGDEEREVLRLWHATLKQLWEDADKVSVRSGCSEVRSG